MCLGVFVSLGMNVRKQKCFSIYLQFIYINVILKLMYCNVRVDINDDSISLTKKSDKFYSLSTFER